MKSKITFSLLIFFVCTTSYAVDSISFLNGKEVRAISLKGDILSYDSLKGQKEDKKLSDCAKKQFHQEIKKLVNYSDKSCSDPRKILVEVESIKRYIYNCSVRLPRYEETLVTILNCGK